MKKQNNWLFLKQGVILYDNISKAHILTYFLPNTQNVEFEQKWKTHWPVDSSRGQSSLTSQHQAALDVKNVCHSPLVCELQVRVPRQPPDLASVPVLDHRRRQPPSTLGRWRLLSPGSEHVLPLQHWRCVDAEESILVRGTPQSIPLRSGVDWPNPACSPAAWQVLYVKPFRASFPCMLQCYFLCCVQLLHTILNFGLTIACAAPGWSVARGFAVCVSVCWVWGQPWSLRPLASASTSPVSR